MAEAGGTGIFQELHAAIVPVSDLEKARAWYEDVLELTPKRVVEGALAVYGTSGPTHLCLYVPEPGVEHPGYAGQGAFPNWRADDIETAQRRLLEKGVACTEVQVAGTFKWCTFFDPDGNRHDICEYGSDWLP